MAVKKKATVKTTVSKKTSKSGSAEFSTDYPDDFSKDYMRLRTVLDSIELMALRYCLKDADPSKRIRRAKEIEAELMPLIRKYNDNINSGLPSQICPDGFNDCGGCCVPYPCP